MHFQHQNWFIIPDPIFMYLLSMTFNCFHILSLRGGIPNGIMEFIYSTGVLLLAWIVWYNAVILFEINLSLINPHLFHQSFHWKSGLIHDIAIYFINFCIYKSLNTYPLENAIILVLVEVSSSTACNTRFSCWF